MFKNDLKSLKNLIWKLLINFEFVDVWLRFDIQENLFSKDHKKSKF